MALEALPTDTAYRTINAWFDARFGDDAELDTVAFYRLLFEEGELETHEERDEKAPGRYAAICACVYHDVWTHEGKKVRAQGERHSERHTLTDELDGLDEIVEDDSFCVMPPISYAGARMTAKNARKLYAIAIDVDGIACRAGQAVGLDQLLWQCSERMPEIHRLPMPTAIVSSGSGIHVYWMLERPIRLFPHIVKQLRRLRERLTWLLWTQGISAYSDRIQYEGVYQGLRMVGSTTKYGDRVRAWRTGEKVTISELNKYVPADCRVDDEHYHALHTLAYAQEHWPDWYERRIVRGEKRKTWTCSEGLYKWWAAKAYDAEVGHRYFAMMMLSVYAIKCDIPYDRLCDDMDALAQHLDMHSPEDNRITDIDICDALHAYDESYKTYPINSIAYLTGIEIHKNKRNGRKRSDHVKLMNFVRDEINGHKNTWRNKEGRPSKQEIIHAWRVEHPDGRKIDCQRALGISRPTVLKWWDT